MKPFKVICGVFDGDAEVLAQTLDWCAELGPQPADLVVLTDGEMNRQWNPGGFQSMRVIPMPPRPGIRKPVLEAVVQHHDVIRKEYPDNPFLLLESDSIPLERHWLEALLDGHGPDLLNTVSGNWVQWTSDASEPFLNGVAIYPGRYRAPEVPPSVLYGVDRTNNRRFHPSLHFIENERMVHIWGDERGEFLPLDSVGAPSFPERKWLEALRCKHPHAALFHRNKDGSLIARLREPETAIYRNDLPALFTRHGFQTGVEVGVCAGWFSEVILNKWSGTLHLVDVWDGTWPWWDVPQDGMARMEHTIQRLSPWRNRVVFHRARSPGAAARFSNRSLDWVYLDGDHSYCGALNDLEAWYPKLRRGGIISGHDYLDSTVNYDKPMDVPESDRHLLTLWGVRSAVKEFRRRHGIIAPVHVTAEDVASSPSFWWVKS